MKFPHFTVLASGVAGAMASDGFLCMRSDAAVYRVLGEKIYQPNASRPYKLTI